MSTMPESLNEIRYQIEEYLDGLNIPLQGRNRKINVNNRSTWARLSHLGGEAKSAELGGKWIRDRGFIVVSLFFPLGEGTIEADRIAYNLRDSFTEWRYNYFETGVGDVNEVTTTEDFYHLNVTLPYRHK